MSLNCVIVKYHLNWSPQSFDSVFKKFGQIVFLKYYIFYWILCVTFDPMYGSIVTLPRINCNTNTQVGFLGYFKRHIHFSISLSFPYAMLNMYVKATNYICVSRKDIWYFIQMYTFVTIDPFLFLFFQLRNMACYNWPRTDMGWLIF